MADNVVAATRVGYPLLGINITTFRAVDVNIYDIIFPLAESGPL